MNLFVSFSYQPTDALRATLDYTKSKLVRNDTGRTAFDVNIYALRATYQFSRFTFARARLDYDTLASNLRTQGTVARIAWENIIHPSAQPSLLGNHPREAE